MADNSGSLPGARSAIPPIPAGRGGQDFAGWAGGVTTTTTTVPAAPGAASIERVGSLRSSQTSTPRSPRSPAGPAGLGANMDHVFGVPGPRSSLSNGEGSAVPNQAGRRGSLSGSISARAGGKPDDGTAGFDLAGVGDAVADLGETVGHSLFQMAEQVVKTQRAFQEKLAAVKAAKKKAEAAVHARQLELETMQAKHVTQSEIIELQTSNIKDLGEQNSHLSIRIGALEKKLAAKEKTLADALEAQQQTTEEHATSRAAIEADTAAHKDEAQKLAKKNAETQARFKAAVEKSKALAAERDAARDAADDIAAKSKTGESEVKSLKRQHQQQLKKEKDRLEKDMAQVKATMETTVKSLKASNTKLSEEKLKAELQGKALKKRCEAEAAKGREEVSELLQMTSQAERENATLREEIVQLQLALKEANDPLARKKKMLFDANRLEKKRLASKKGGD